LSKKWVLVPTFLLELKCIVRETDRNGKE